MESQFEKYLLCESHFDEATISPKVGEETAGRIWRDLTATAGRIALDSFFTGVGNNISDIPTTDVDNVTAYAFAYIYSPTARSANLVTGSDDGLEIWLNGNVVMDQFYACRSYNANSDTNTVSRCCGVSANAHVQAATISSTSTGSTHLA